MSDAGHLFVTAGDLTQLSCDGVLVPTDRFFNITGAFAALVGLDGAMRLDGQNWNGRAIVPMVGAPTDGPTLWLADVATGTSENNWAVAVAEEFILQAAEAIDLPALKRRPLLALPVLGTGDGGWEDRSGSVSQSLIETLLSVVHERPIDVVLVTRGRASYSAAQRVRLGVLNDDPLLDTFDLGCDARDVDLTRSAEWLASHARRGELVLFLGAGVSAGAGLPAWQELIDSLSEALPKDRKPSSEKLHRLDLRDQAAVLRRRYEANGSSFNSALQQQLHHTRHGLTHELAASLPTTEAVTTNYDTLFEQAVEATLDTIAVLPRDPARTADRWLLKLHGDIGDAASMVLTREDYLRLPKAGGALFGLVQGMLMTRHMLFVGYSLSDEDFHHLVDEVRSAQGGAERPGAFGTVLTLFDDELFRDLWEADLRILAMHPEPADPSGPTAEEFATAARRMQIFLDLLGLLSADHQAFLLNPSYEGMLTDDERHLRDALERLAAARPRSPGAEWAQVDALLSSLGQPARATVPSDE